MKKKKIASLLLAVVLLVSLLPSLAFAYESPAQKGYIRWGSANWVTLRDQSNLQGYKIFAKLVQHYMNQRYSTSTNIYPILTMDGLYGSSTKQRVRDFQYQSGIASDGITGPNTWGRLFDQMYWVGTDGGRRNHFGARIYANGMLTDGLVGLNASANFKEDGGIGQPYWQNKWGDLLTHAY